MTTTKLSIVFSTSIFAAIGLALCSCLTNPARAGDKELMQRYAQLGEAARTSGRLVDAEKYLVGALQIGLKTPALQAPNAAHSNQEFVAELNKFNETAGEELEMIKTTQSLAYLSVDFEKANQFDKAIEVHEWQIKDFEHRGANAVGQYFLIAGDYLKLKNKNAADTWSGKGVAQIEATKAKIKKTDLLVNALALRAYSLRLLNFGANEESQKFTKLADDLQAMAR